MYVLRMQVFLRQQVMLEVNAEVYVLICLHSKDSGKQTKSYKQATSLLR